MRKKQIIILGVVLGLSLLGLIFTQARYFQTAFQLKKAHFDYLVNKSIDQVTTYLEEKDKQQMAEEKKNEIHHLGKNGDRKSTRLNSSHMPKSRMPSSA